jgi:chloramphenicol 3-O-phosphotransferase
MNEAEVDPDPGMILWLNGTFGVGKTTTARAICERRAGFGLFDPETVGSTLVSNLGDRRVADFQDLPEWRSLVPKTAARMLSETGKDLVAVQTVLVESYWEEIRRGLAELRVGVVHVLLDCSEAVLRERIAQDDLERGAEAWRLHHLEQYQVARKWLVPAADLVVDTSTLSPDEVVERVISALPAAL